MAAITTRAGKGTSLTNAELDANFTNINDEVGGKVDAAGVRATVLTGLSTALGTVVTAAHTVLEAIGFLQKQVSDNLASAANASNLTSGTVNDARLPATMTGKTLSGAVLNDGYTEEVFGVTGTTPALNPANGSIQTWILGANCTPTYSFAAGQSMTLMIDDGAGYTITWPTTTWLVSGGAAPTLATTGYTAVVLWKVGTVVYGKY